MTRTETADEACSHVGFARPNTGNFSQKFTKGTLYYIEKPVNGEKLYTKLLPSEQAEKSTDSNLRRNKKEIVVYDIRTAGRPFSLLTNGFELHKFDVPKSIVWQNSDQVNMLVLPLMVLMASSVSWHGWQDLISHRSEPDADIFHLDRAPASAYYAYHYEIRTPIHNMIHWGFAGTTTFLPPCEKNSAYFKVIFAWPRTDSRIHDAALVLIGLLSDLQQRHVLFVISYLSGVWALDVLLYSPPLSKAKSASEHWPTCTRHRLIRSKAHYRQLPCKPKYLCPCFTCLAPYKHLNKLLLLLCWPFRWRWHSIPWWINC